MTRATYSFSFEFDTAPPITVKGTVTGQKLRTLYGRAAADAAEQQPGLNWQSCVCVLERESDVNPEEQDRKDSTEKEETDGEG